MSSLPNVDITRKVRFSASHRYHRDEWSDEKNREVFGACNNPFGHGHNYELEVTLAGQPRDMLNELECVGDAVFANVWQTDTILRIDPQTGTVGAQIAAAGLLETEGLVDADVLSGIVDDPETGNFLSAGKLWQLLFEVRCVPVTLEEEN